MSLQTIRHSFRDFKVMWPYRNLSCVNKTWPFDPPLLNLVVCPASVHSLDNTPPSESYLNLACAEDLCRLANNGGIRPTTVPSCSFGVSSNEKSGALTKTAKHTHKQKSTWCLVRENRYQLIAKKSLKTQFQKIISSKSYEGLVMLLTLLRQIPCPF